MRNSHALTTPPRRLAAAAGISQYKPPPPLADVALAAGAGRAELVEADAAGDRG